MYLVVPFVIISVLANPAPATGLVPTAYRTGLALAVTRILVELITELWPLVPVAVIVCDDIFQILISYLVQYIEYLVVTGTPTV
jgi:hypothetical protein